MPAYTCPTMAYAVKRAGLRVRLCDVNPSTLNFDMDSLKKILCDRTLCVVPTHLFGFPCAHLDETIAMSRKCGAFIVEDVCQSAGARRKGRKLGSFGDAAIFSLGKGKNFTTIHGGIITTDSSIIAKRINEYYGALTKPGIRHALNIYMKLILYSIFIRPLGFKLITQVVNPEDVDYEYHERNGLLFDFQAAMADVLLRSLDELNATRKRNGMSLYSELEGLQSAYIIFTEEPESSAVYPAFPLLVRDIDKLRLVYAELIKSGIGVARMYPASLKSLVNGDDCCENAEYVSRRLLVLPTNCFLNQNHISLIGSILRRVAAI